MRRSLVIVLPLLLVFGLGLAGTYAAGLDLPFSQRLYLVLQLFAVEGEWTTTLAPVPWSLEAARFLAPLATLASLAWVFLERARRHVSNTLGRFARDHVVCVGLDDRTWHFLLACRDDGRRVTVITESRDSALLAEARRLGHRVLEADRIDDAVLLRAAVQRARHLVVFTADDGDNVEIALRTKRLLSRRPRRGMPLQIRLHLEDTRLATRLEDYPKFFEDYDVAEVGFFNVHERSARRLFADHAFERFADILDAPRVHIAIFGRGALPEAVLLHALRQAHYADGAAPRLSLFCTEAEAARSSFEAAHPGASGAGELDWIETRDTDAEHAETLPGDLLSTVTAYIVCLEPDVRALRTALALRTAVLSGRGDNGPIFVAMQHGRGLARLLESRTGEPEVPDGIYPFGMLEEVLATDQVLDERQDRLARAIHEDYLASLARPAQADVRTLPSHRPWSHLPEVYRRENRNQADHLETKLRSIDRSLSATAPATPLTAAEVEGLAELEQRRWRATRLSHGWRPGTRRSDLQKVHDALLPFDALSEDLRARNRASIAQLPGLLRDRVGLGTRPIVHVGVTGHRPDRLPGPPEHLERALRRTFEAIAAEHPGADIVVLSALAEGADRMAARIALDVVGARLHVPLPLPYALYQETFGDADGQGRAESSAEFRSLVGRAECYFELPLRAGPYDAMAATDAEDLRARQYALSGAWILGRSQEFVAVWDGAPSRGEGSTADLIRWHAAGVPEQYAYGHRYFPRRPRVGPWILPAAPAPDHRPRRADP